MRMVGLEELDTYIARRQEMVDQYISTWNIIYLCMKA